MPCGCPRETGGGVVRPAGTRSRLCSPLGGILEFGEGPETGHEYDGLNSLRPIAPTGWAKLASEWWLQELVLRAQVAW